MPARSRRGAFCLGAGFLFIRMAAKLLSQSSGEDKVDAVVIGVTLAGSFAAAFALQKVVLDALLRALSSERRVSGD